MIIDYYRIFKSIFSKLASIKLSKNIKLADHSHNLFHRNNVYLIKHRIVVKCNFFVLRLLLTLVNLITLPRAINCFSINVHLSTLRIMKHYKRLYINLFITFNATFLGR